MPQILFSIIILILSPIFISAEEYASFQSQELRCIIGNNAEMNEHRAGYNGVFNLTSIHQPRTIFVPAYAGLNLEHVFHKQLDLDNRTEFFEPRNAPMTFTKIDDRTAKLFQPPTPHTHMESTTIFRLVDPYYIDMEFTCKPTRNVFENNAFGIFWASYIHAPEDKSMYFLRGALNQPPMWQQFVTQYHNHDSTIRAFDDTFRWNFADSYLNETLFTSFSKVNFRDPFYYGRFENMVLIYMLKSDEIIRFAHSPAGGGFTPSGDDTCPAWDFQMIVPKAEVGKEYSLKIRAVYKQWVDRDDVLKEYKKFSSQ